MEVEKRRELVSQQFKKKYGSPPTIWVQAPGRVDLMGSHTDYNDGYVLTQAIDRNTWIAARPRRDGQVTISSLNAAGTGHFSLDLICHDEDAPWTNYVRGVAQVMQESGYSLSGFEGLVHSTVPFGSGLSSSAALEVATAVLFDALSDLDIDGVQLALMCQRAENEFVGMNCGILDQYSSLMGAEDSVILLDCRHLSNEITPIAEGMSVVICDTRSNRALTGSEYPERRAQCEQGARILSSFNPQVRALRDVTLSELKAHEQDMPEIVYRRCLFVVEENQRVLDMARAVESGDEAFIGRLTADSYAGARDLYEVSSPEMAAMIEAMTSGPGVIGARQAGAGFGGCMVALVAEGEIVTFARHVSDMYWSSTGIEAAIYPVQAAPGASLLPF